MCSSWPLEREGFPRALRRSTNLVKARATIAETDITIRQNGSRVACARGLSPLIFSYEYHLWFIRYRNGICIWLWIIIILIKINLNKNEIMMHADAHFGSPALLARQMLRRRRLGHLQRGASSSALFYGEKIKIPANYTWTCSYY